MSALARALAVFVLTSPLLAACGGGAASPPACGDRAIDAGESCDDGNSADGDGCAATCQVEAGYLCSGQPSTCSAACGNGAVGGVEVCDDGNAADGDGCSATCLAEPGYVCVGQPSTCSAACGNGAVGGGEACDDGNAADGDGCAATCQVEPGFSCAGEPSACFPLVQRVDAWAPGGLAEVPASFVSGDAVAVRLGPLPRAVTVTAVRLFFGGAATTRTVTLRLYRDVGLAAPGAVLFEGDFELTGSDAALQELSLSVGIPAGEAFRVAVFLQHAGLPGVAQDGGGGATPASWVFPAGSAWTPWTSVGGTGNFILRAVVE